MIYQGTFNYEVHHYRTHIVNAEQYLLSYFMLKCQAHILCLKGSS